MVEAGSPRDVSTELSNAHSGIHWKMCSLLFFGVSVELDIDTQLYWVVRYALC